MPTKSVTSQFTSRVHPLTLYQLESRHTLVLGPQAREARSSVGTQLSSLRVPEGGVTVAAPQALGSKHDTTVWYM